MIDTCVIGVRNQARSDAARVLGIAADADLDCYVGHKHVSGSSDEMANGRGLRKRGQVFRGLD